MFRIFRRIREEILLGNVARRYLGYAVGELILVVLGILIALQINNWNEERIEQRQIAEKISAYEAFTYHLEGDFDFDRAVGTKSVELAGTVIDMNYSGVFHYFPVDQLESFSFPDSPIHEVYKETNLSLLTDDMKDIKVAANSYLVLGSYYGIRPRAEVEIPKLVAEAQELIALLKEEYPE